MGDAEEESLHVLSWQHFTTDNTKWCHEIKGMTQVNLLVKQYVFPVQCITSGSLFSLKKISLRENKHSRK